MNDVIHIDSPKLQLCSECGFTKKQIVSPQGPPDKEVKAESRTLAAPSLLLGKRSRPKAKDALSD